MRDQDHQVANLYGGAYIPPSGHRGRTSQPISDSSRRWVVAAFLALLFGFTTAAAAITTKQQPPTVQSTYSAHTLPANFGLRSLGGGFEEALY